MLQIRKSGDRGHAHHGWLESHHSFSFADYHDPRFTGHGPLLVINEDTVAPGRGFGTHSHRDMEIVSYVLAGALEHRDSMGNGSVLAPGDVQRMSAGSGVRHSEMNHSSSQSVHFLQIWIAPKVKGIEPGYQETHFTDADKRGRLRLIASGDGRDGSVLIHQDASLYAALLDGAEQAELALAPARLAYVHVVRGSITVNGLKLDAGDAVLVREEAALAFTAAQQAELLVFDLPPS